MIQIEKRNGRGFEPFDPTKIQKAVLKAANRTTDVPYDWEPLLNDVSTLVYEDISKQTSVTVDDVHTSVENTLMKLDMFDVAREYITYRKEHMPDLFRPRKNYRPFEYPQLHQYVDAIRQSYWTHDEFDFTADIQDFMVNMTGSEKEAVRRCMLAISHVEATVKTFWTKLGDRMPKPELAEIGVTMGESEVRHANAYAELLNVLGLNDDFESILQVPAMAQRQTYMEKALAGRDGNEKEYLKTIVFFSLFVENVSLFSQFLIIMMINQKQNYLKGTSNVISSTGLEETLHANLGSDIVNLRRVESPSWFDHQLDVEVESMVKESYEAERNIIDWIFELGEIPAVSKSTVIEYIKNRYNKGLIRAGFTPYFTVNQDLLQETEFFDIQMATTSHVDFFHKRSSNYTKKAASFDEDSLF